VIALAGKAALVTGGAGTLGRALARVLLDAGMRVAIADLDEARLEAAARMLGAPEALSQIVLDVADPNDWRRAADALEARIGPIALLCNNAGVAGARAPLLDLPVERWNRMLEVNLTGVFLGARLFAPRMIAAGGGHILNTASMGGLLAQKGLGEYCAAKAGVIRLSETLHAELAPRGVGVSVLCPGAIGHPVGHAAVAGEPAAASGRMDPVEGVRIALAAMLSGEFYLFTHPDARPHVARYGERLLAAYDRVAPTSP
jgi:NAD(P)-dependent dehydrogenase (short-subunit alcohol dehydrogenase family)